MFKPKERRMVGVVIMEVVLDLPDVALPAVEDWRLLYWPHARLGSGTIRATTTATPSSVPHLLEALRQAGVRPVGQPIVRARPAEAWRGP